MTLKPGSSTSSSDSMRMKFLISSAMSMCFCGRFDGVSPRRFHHGDTESTEIRDDVRE
jgi:hypothetical protein